MVGTSASTKKKQKFYNSTEQDISREGGDCATNFGYLLSRCFYMVYLVKTHVENGLSKLFDLRGQTIDMSDRDVFTLKYSGLHDEEGKKINIREPLTAHQNISGRFV